jgi:hypothetical protein
MSAALSDHFTGGFGDGMKQAGNFARLVSNGAKGKGKKGFF